MVHRRYVVTCSALGCLLLILNSRLLALIVSIRLSAFFIGSKRILVRDRWSVVDDDNDDTTVSMTTVKVTMQQQQQQ